MRSVIFDLDGTLANTASDLLAAANAAFEALGHAAPLISSDAATSGRGSIAMLKLGEARLGLTWTDSERAAARKILLDHYEANIAQHSHFFDGAADTLKRLRLLGWRVAICTNKPHYLAEKLLTALGTRDLFDAVVGADTLPVMKPDPAPLLHAIELAGGTPDLAVMVGDTITDRNAAANAGIPVILVTLGPEGDDVFGMEPEAIMSDYRELPGLLEQLCPRT